MTPSNFLRVVVSCAVLTVIVATTDARAQIVVRFNPSVRAAGMGEAGTAVFWGVDPNDWANPALLGYQRGLMYRWSRTELLPELTDDIFYSSHRVSYGWGGVGIDWSYLKLSYGESQGTDEMGNPTGTFESFERVQPLGIGISVSELTNAIAGLRGENVPAFTRYVDLAIGYAHKSIKMELAPVAAGIATTNSADLGVLAVVTPMPGLGDSPSLDLSYGFASLNHDDAKILFPNEDTASPVPRESRNGFGARFAVPVGDELEQSLAKSIGGWIASGMSPLVSIGLAADFTHVEAGFFGGAYDVDQYGLEMEMLGTLTARIGHYQDKEGGIDGMTYGFGVGIPFGGFSGVRYDIATRPQGGGLGPLSRHAITAWFDPVAFARR